MRESIVRSVGCGEIHECLLVCRWPWSYNNDANFACEETNIIIFISGAECRSAMFKSVEKGFLLMFLRVRPNAYPVFTSMS